MSEDNALIFISYADEATNYATQAKEVFESNSYRTWVWEYDRPGSGDRDDILMAAIQACDQVAFICTPSTRKSEGQIKEGAWAKAFGKVPPILLAFHPEYILEMFSTPKLFNLVAIDSFRDDCQTAIGLLERRQPFPEAREASEGDPVRFEEEAGIADPGVVKTGESSEPA